MPRTTGPGSQRSPRAPHLALDEDTEAQKDRREPSLPHFPSPQAVDSARAPSSVAGVGCGGHSWLQGHQMPEPHPIPPTAPKPEPPRVRAAPWASVRCSRAVFMSDLAEHCVGMDVGLTRKAARLHCCPSRPGPTAHPSQHNVSARLPKNRPTAKDEELPLLRWCLGPGWPQATMQCVSQDGTSEGNGHNWLHPWPVAPRRLPFLPLLPLPIRWGKLLSCNHTEGLSQHATPHTIKQQQQTLRGDPEKQIKVEVKMGNLQAHCSIIYVIDFREEGRNRER